MGTIRSCKAVHHTLYCFVSTKKNARALRRKWQQYARIPWQFSTAFAHSRQHAQRRSQPLFEAVAPVYATECERRWPRRRRANTSTASGTHQQHVFAGGTRRGIDCIVGTVLERKCFLHSTLSTGCVTRVGGGGQTNENEVREGVKIKLSAGNTST